MVSMIMVEERPAGKFIEQILGCFSRSGRPRTVDSSSRRRRRRGGQGTGGARGAGRVGARRRWTSRRGVHGGRRDIMRRGSDPGAFGRAILLLLGCLFARLLVFLGREKRRIGVGFFLRRRCCRGGGGRPRGWVWRGFSGCGCGWRWRRSRRGDMCLGWRGGGEGVGGGEGGRGRLELRFVDQSRRGKCGGGQAVGDSAEGGRVDGPDGVFSGREGRTGVEIGSGRTGIAQDSSMRARRRGGGRGRRVGGEGQRGRGGGRGRSRSRTGGAGGQRC